MRVSLVRTEYGLTETLGTLLIDGALFCVTLEPPWRDNRQSISSIPEGQYQCRRYNSPKYGKVFEVLDVPIRANIILGHIGNTHRNSDGCILFGSYPGHIDGTRAVMDSGRAIAAWQDITRNIDELNLHIWGMKGL